MNTLGKLLDTVLAKRIQYLAEQYQLIPKTHVGGRKASSCEHGIHLLLEKIHAAWWGKKTASLLLLDVSGAFDNVSHTRPFHNLRKRQTPGKIVSWIASSLENRKSTIKLQE
jgi:hypothetical protein